ncbi:MAG: hypothetical protein M3Z46_08860 [Actinomycetota bacterium]|nr:hypothetical protein [Actinomycetota bacterium]
MAVGAALDTEELEPLTDDELTALALAADPDAVVDADAPSFWSITAAEAVGPLPEWYMPSTAGATRLPRGWRRRVVLVIIISFLAIAASGLCSTYGPIVIA